MPRTPVLNIPAALAQLPLFSSLTPEELGRLAARTRELHAARGELLFHKGDPNTGFHLLLSGQVKLFFTSAQGNEKVVEIIHPGQSFGEAIMFMETPYIVSGQALADCHLLHVAKEAVFAELARDPALARKMLASMAVRLHQLMADLEANAMHSGRQRVIAYLLRERPPAAGQGAVTLHLSLAKNVIASRLSLTQEHFSRILHELDDAGLIQVRGREIDIPDITALEQLV